MPTPPEPLSWFDASVSAGARRATPVIVPAARSGAVTVVSSAVLVDRDVVVRRRKNRRVGKVDRQRRRRQVAVAVLDRVDEHVGGVRRDVVRRRLVGVAAVGMQMQRAVLAGNVGLDPVDTAVVVSPPAARTPSIVTPSAPATSFDSTPAAATVSSAPSFTLPLSAVAVGTSSTM